ncbi:hypothetical protein BWQ96_06257 [Gracilariopsis chorda]|uniref:Aminoglycoside phosphotransferase domain-containing protein n=1 Tax=Gracilariopsis chorda TaxID=448386 RepID=A0A2V3IPN0_9FLOR|nr:hypothetical protein BWQ96_06257 [Gracilariopsis chorda]|eukprot:PXF44024.1 hypothetical protein BWQ96_06257 [Gracilariopsis chorda]
MVRDSFGVECFCVGPLSKGHAVQNPNEEQVLMVEVLPIYGSDHVKGLLWVARNDIRNFVWKPIRGNIRTELVLFRCFHDPTFVDVNSGHHMWRKPGWFQHVDRCISMVLSLRGYSKVSVTQLQNTVKSSVLMVEAVESEKASMTGARSDTRFYVKTVEQGSREGLITKQMASFAGSIVPEVIAVNEGLNSFIQIDAGLKHYSPNATALLTSLGQLQRMSIPHLGELQKSGMPTYSVQWVINNVESILKCPTIRNCVETNKRSLLETISVIKGLCQELHTEGLPSTVVHGDLHLANIASRCRTPDWNPKYSFIDWGSSFLGHPMMDVRVLLQSLSHEIDFDQDEVLSQYLKFWNWKMTTVRLNRLLRIAGLCYWIIDLHSIIHNQDGSRSYSVSERVMRLRLILRRIEGS